MSPNQPPCQTLQPLPILQNLSGHFHQRAAGDGRMHQTVGCHLMVLVQFPDPILCNTGGIPLNEPIIQIEGSFDAVLVKNLHQHIHHEIHWGEIIIIDQDLILPGYLDLLPRLFPYTLLDRHDRSSSFLSSFVSEASSFNPISFGPT